MTTPDTTTAPGHYHARRRAAERYGLTLTDADCRRITKRIRSGPPLSVRVGHGRERTRVVAAVRWKGEWVLVVYDAKTDYLITFLPAWEVKRHRAVLERESGVTACPCESSSASQLLPSPAWTGSGEGSR